MTPRIVPPEVARAFLAECIRIGTPHLSPTIERWIQDAARTAAVLGEQREAVLAIHARTSLGYCDYCWDVPNNEPKKYPCSTARAAGVSDD